MKVLKHMIRSLVLDPPPGLKLRATEVGVEALIRATERWQEVRINVDEENVIMTSVVLDRRDVTKNAGRWRELALEAWERNHLTDVVVFQFDDADNLVGRVSHPRVTLDPPELRFYVQTLLEECDRFEYVLTGEDTY